MVATKTKISTTRRMIFLRRLHLLRSLTKSSSVKTSAIIMDALLYICALKLKLEVLRRENTKQICNMKHVVHLPNKKKVKVEKLVDGFLVKVRSEEKGAEVLVLILEAFEEMGVSVRNARVCCNMEATVEVQEHQALNVEIIARAVLKAV